MLDGAEEDATVISVDCVHQVTIRLDSGTQVTYASDINRLRLVSSSSSPAFTQAPAENANTAHALDVGHLKSALVEKLAPSGIPETAVKVNAHAAPGSQMHTKFAQRAKELADTHVLDVLLHGSSEDNVPSILRSSLLLTKSKNLTSFWLTTNLQTARVRMIAVCLLRRN
jgi:hypothetical protein